MYIALEFQVNAGRYFEEIIKNGILCSLVDNKIIRFIPPLIITREELDWALDKIINIINS